MQTENSQYTGVTMRYSGLVWLSLFFSAHAWGCVCARWPSAKDAWKDSPVVFLGTVERADPGWDVDRATFGWQRASVRVEEPFKGVQKNQVLELLQPNNDCTPTFKSGERVVFYLHPGAKAGVWVARGCHRTRDLEGAADDLLFLRGLPGSAKGTRVSGEVTDNESTGPVGFRRPAVLPGIKVTVSSENSPPLIAFTNADGVYEFYGVPAGKHKVAIEIPPGLRIDFVSKTGRRSLDFHDTTFELGPDWGVSIDFPLMADTAISGRVLDPDGNPLEGVCVEVETITREALETPVFNCTKADGSYKLEMMPPGEYRVVANREGIPTARQPFGRVYYPGVMDLRKALPVAVSAGGVAEGIDIRVPSVRKLVQISGMVQFSDGQPVAKAWVVSLAPHGNERQRKIAGADGSFSFSELAGQGGAVHAEIMVPADVASSCPQFEAVIRPNGFAAFLKTADVAVSGESDRTNVVLLFPMKSCSAWPPAWLK